MKKSLLILTTMIAVASAFGQGTVRFSNVPADLSSPPDREVRFAVGANNPTLSPFVTNGAPVNNVGTTSYRAQLYYGSSTATEGSLIAVTTAPAVFRASTGTPQGAWAAGNRTMVGFIVGDTVTLLVRVWDNQFASSWEAAQALGAGYAGYLGQSLRFQYAIPTDPLAPLSAFTMANFQGFTIGAVPEPATFALAGLGALSLFLFRRRK